MSGKRSSRLRESTLHAGTGAASDPAARLRNAADRASFIASLPEASAERTKALLDMMIALFVKRNLPLSDLESPAFVDLIQTCAALPSLHVQCTMSRQSLMAELDRQAKALTEATVSSLTSAVLTLGQGAFFLQIDSARAQRGEHQPVFVSWVDPSSMKRSNVVLGVGYDTARTAEDSAQNVHALLKELDLVARLEKALTDRTDTRNLPAKGHFASVFTATTAAYQRQVGMPLQDAKVAALAAYMFGSATTHGALLPLLDLVINASKRQDTNDPGLKPKDALAATESRAKATAASAVPAAPAMFTNHCCAHRLSLVARFAFGDERQDQGEAWPPEGESRLIAKDFWQRVQQLVAFYYNMERFAELQEFARKRGLFEPHPMTPAHSSRLESAVQMLKSVSDNIALFCDILGRDALHNPEAVHGFHLEQKVEIAGGTVRYHPMQQLEALRPIVDRLTDLTSYAGIGDRDAGLFQAHLSRFVRQLHASTASAGASGAAASSPSYTVLIDSVVENLKQAIGFYFDQDLCEGNRAMLLNLALHPSSVQGVSSTWGCLAGRFQTMPAVQGADEAGRGDAASVVAAKVMAAGKEVLRQELALQYDIDNGTWAEACKARQLGGFSTERSATQDDLFPPHSRFQSEEKWEAHKAQVVESEINAWLARPAPENLVQTMLDFWREAPDGLLKHVAIRAGAFMVSQYAPLCDGNTFTAEDWDSRDFSDRDAACLKRDVLLHIAGPLL